MNIIKSAYLMYFEGFKNMTIGKTLWKIVFIKLFVILIVLNLIVHNKTFKSEYKTDEQKSEFVSSNLARR
ncbi:MAG: DUF4492 domain-containing protein [Arcobacteraceae bacterium]|jgi:hypothetical protein|nr:DUF4492 domain-containing protein [Arcobacteraceae bacterium]MDY0364536.1 DUF4492 domain-containing protein [Arcobacteraceae bacterium]